jgi:hypothetical protein
MAVAVIAIVSIIIGVTVPKCSNRDDKDYGYIKVKVNNQMVDLTLLSSPTKENYVWNIIADNSVDMELLTEAIDVWHQRTGRKLFSYRQNQDYFDNPMFVLADDPLVPSGVDYRSGTVSVRVVTISDKEEYGGVTNHIYDIETGKVYWVDITINAIHTYNKDVYRAALIHELGHALLLDDEEEHETSIMRRRLNTSGVITESDAQRVRDL